LAPRWTRAGYKGRLKNAIKKACDLDKPDNANNLDQPGLQVEAMDDNLDQPDSQDTMVIAGSQDQPDSQDTLAIGSGLESEIDALSILQLAYSDEYISDVGIEEEEEVEEVVLTSNNPDVQSRRKVMPDLVLCNKTRDLHYLYSLLCYFKCFSHDFAT
jgi:hypothetical protein